MKRIIRGIMERDFASPLAFTIDCVIRMFANRVHVRHFQTYREVCYWQAGSNFYPVYFVDVSWRKVARGVVNTVAETGRRPKEVFVVHHLGSGYVAAAAFDPTIYQEVVLCEILQA